MKIKFKDKRQWGANVNIPTDGVVTIGKAGITEVSEEAAKILLTKSTDWEQVPGEKDVVGKVVKVKKQEKSAKKESKKQVVEDEEETNDEDSEADESTDEESEEATATDDELDNMDLENLVNIAETSDITGWEKFRNNEKALRTFLKNRLNS